VWDVCDWCLDKNAHVEEALDGFLYDSERGLGLGAVEQMQQRQSKLVSPAIFAFAASTA
jgi:hypothetical protein